MSTKSVTPSIFVSECCEFDAEACAPVGSLADALAGYRLHHGKRAEPVTWSAVRRILEGRGCVITEPDIGSTSYKSVKLSPAGEAMVEEWGNDPEQSLRCGCCGELRLVGNPWVVCLSCSLFTLAPDASTEGHDGVDPVEIWFQAGIERALERNFDDAQQGDLCSM